MRGEKAKGVLKIESFEGNNNERKRAQYLLTLLQTGNESKARKTSGLTRKAHQRILDMMAKRGSFMDAPRSGRPAVYQEATLEGAQDFLITFDKGYLTGTQLHQLLVEKGMIHSSANVNVFMRHLRKHVESQGQKLIANSVKTTFFISNSDAADRVAYARTMMEQLRSSKSLEQFIFVDETTLEESPHPKGEVLDLQKRR